MCEDEHGDVNENDDIVGSEEEEAQEGLFLLKL